MKITFPKLTTADTLGVSTVLGVAVFAGLHYGLKVDAVTAGAVATAATGALGYVIPDTAVAAAAAPLEQLVEDAARAVATQQIAAAIPKLTTDALAALAAFMAAHAQTAPAISLTTVPPAPTPTPAPVIVTTGTINTPVANDVVKPAT